MVKGNPIKNEALESAFGNPDYRDGILVGSLGLSDLEDIQAIRDISGLENRIVEAARFLYDTAGCGEAITLRNLAAICYSDWRDEYQLYVGDVVRKTYERELSLVKKLRLRVPSTHFLREEIGAYSGNLIEAKSFYPKMQISHEDFQRSVKIPIPGEDGKFSKEESMLLGVLWGEASATSGDTGIHMTTRSNREFYYILENKFSKLFNIEVVSLDNDQYRLTLGSYAVYSWLTNAMGLPAGNISRSGGQTINLPAPGFDDNGNINFDGPIDWQSFLDGYVATTGINMSINKSGLCLLMFGRAALCGGRPLNKKMAKICRHLGDGRKNYDVRFRDASGHLTIYLSKEELVDWTFINPKHAQFVEANWDNIKDNRTFLGGLRRKISF